MRREARLAVRAAGVAVALAVLAAGALPVAARHEHVNDGRDTQGVLDVRRIKTAGKEMRPLWKIVTFKKWTPQRIFERGYFVIHLDMRGDGFFEHYVMMRSTGSGMHARLFRQPRNKPGRDLGRVNAWRRDDNSVTARLPIHDLLGSKRSRYRWRIASLFTNKNCTQVCIDRIPDTGAIVEEVGAEEPDPIPTPDPSPTPDPVPTP